MEWNGKWYEMEREFWYGIWKMLRRNGMEDLKNETEDRFPYFHTTVTTYTVYTKTYNKLQSTTKLEWG